MMKGVPTFFIGSSGSTCLVHAVGGILTSSSILSLTGKRDFSYPPGIMVNWKYGLAITIADEEGKSGKEAHYLLSTNKVTLGRGGANSIALKNDAVSTNHCELIQKRGGAGFSLKDLGSTNGTQLNEEELESGISYELRDGDILIVGLHVKARFYRMQEVGGKPKSDSGSKTGGATTQKLSKIPTINPVAAAVAKAGKSR